jgi:hypothetical protein
MSTHAPGAANRMVDVAAGRLGLGSSLVEVLRPGPHVTHGGGRP